MPHPTRTDLFPADSGWLRAAVADDAAARWRDGTVALASAIEAATAAQADPADAPGVGARLAALYDAVQHHLEDLDELADGWSGWPEYRHYVTNLRKFRDDLQAWRFSRGEGRPREGPPPLSPLPGESPMASFATLAWRLVGDAMLLLDLHTAAVAPSPPRAIRAPWWRRWLDAR